MQWNGAATPLTQTGAILGSPAYMSPEQVESRLEDIGPASDVYSLGVVLYEVLTGRLPYQGALMSVLTQIVTGQPPKPSEHRPDVDPRLEAVCLKMMAGKIADRYTSMQEVTEDISTTSGQLRIPNHAAEACRAGVC